MPRPKKTDAATTVNAKQQAIDKVKALIVAKEKEIIKLVKCWDVPLMGDGSEEALAVHRAKLDLDDLEMHLRLLEDPEPPPKKGPTPKDPPKEEWLTMKEVAPLTKLPDGEEIAKPPPAKKKRGELQKLFNKKKKKSVSKEAANLE